MRTLYVFGSGGNLPDPSPFVMKAMLLLKLAGLDYAVKTGGLGKAPKGKLPYLDDNGTVVADSTFIRFYIEKTYGFDYDAGLGPTDRAHAWALEKMCENHLGSFVARERWLKDDNFSNGPIHFFDAVPASIRPLIAALIRRRVRKSLWGQGAGRYSDDEVATLLARDYGAISAVLGEKPYLFGNEPCGADATVFAFVSGGLWNRSKGLVNDTTGSFANLVAYRDRGMARWFPDFKSEDS